MRYIVDIEYQFNSQVVIPLLRFTQAQTSLRLLVVALRSQIGVVPGGHVVVVVRRLGEGELGGGRARVRLADVHLHAEAAADFEALHRVYRYLIVACNGGKR